MSELSDSKQKKKESEGNEKNRERKKNKTSFDRTYKDSKIHKNRCTKHDNHELEHL